jgi:NADH-quinone oxidoreductase subunit F
MRRRDLVAGLDTAAVWALTIRAQLRVQDPLRHLRYEIERRIDIYAANPHPDPVLVAGTTVASTR